MSSSTTHEPSFTQLVAQALMNADRPLTVAEIKARVEMIRPVRARDPQATIRGAINNVTLAVSLGGRPSRYTWWPRHLVDNAFRQPLADSDVEAGTLVLNEEVWCALWPDFSVGSLHSSGDVTLILTDGPVLQTRVEHLVPGRRAWGLPPTTALAEWYRRQEATPDDELIVRVLDADARRYTVTLIHRADRDETAIAARNRTLADSAEKVLRASQRSLPDFWLIPRLIAHDAYRHSLPPDPWADVLRADIRFVVQERNTDLVEKLVDYLEKEHARWRDHDAIPRPHRDRRKARSEDERWEWGVYLFERGMEHIEAGQLFAAEAYYRETLRMAPRHADAWVHLGNLRFGEGRITEALVLYERGQAVTPEHNIAELALALGPLWDDGGARPFMRALRGRGLCLWRLGRTDEARQVFARMLELNPDDNLGVRFLLQGLDEGLSLEESVAKRGKRKKRQSSSFWLAQGGDMTNG